MWRYELHPPHLINVATLPCEIRNSENVILQWGITKENCIKYMVYALSKWTCRLSNFWCYAAMRVWNTDLCDICDLQKRLTQTWVDSKQNVIEAAIDQCRTSVWDHVCVLVATTLNTCCEIMFICIMWFVRRFYETVNVIWCIKRLFRSWR